MAGQLGEAVVAAARAAVAEAGTAAEGATPRAAAPAARTAASEVAETASRTVGERVRGAIPSWGEARHAAGIAALLGWAPAVAAAGAVLDPYTPPPPPAPPASGSGGFTAPGGSGASTPSAAQLAIQRGSLYAQQGEASQADAIRQASWAQANAAAARRRAEREGPPPTLGI